MKLLILALPILILALIGALLIIRHFVYAFDKAAKQAKRENKWMEYVQMLLLLLSALITIWISLLNNFDF